jgi:conjugative relaxase-like TrwC/TraI family protein
MNYFTSADYLSEGQELDGRWRGQGAERLGLSGKIEKKDWDSLCQNLDPHTGQPLTSRLKTFRRVGYDFNFRAPKSLSVLYGITGDERLLNAFRDAVDVTMHEMEHEMQTRVRQNGRDEDRTTGNMVWGEWIHTTARPIGGVPDPHLHAHAFAFNATFDKQENRWKAGQFAGLKRDAPYFEAVFHSRLAERLADLGLDIARNKSGWEIAGFSKDTLDKFSLRKALIEAEAKSHGVSDAESKMEIATQTREKKRNDIPLSKLRTVWGARLTQDESGALKRLADRIGTRPVEREQGGAERAATLAVSNSFERKSVIPERTLLRDALRRSVGQASVEATERAVHMQDLLLADSNGRRFATTLNVLSEETKMIAFARKGRGTCRAFVPGDYIFKMERLNLQQRAAVMHVLRSHDRVMIVNGGAGVGKTTMMKEAVEAVEATGTKVFTFAPSADASRGVLRNEGFANADTVARLLMDDKLQKEVAGNLLWIDEAGFIGSKTMKEIFDLAERLECRVVLSGDVHQHGSVERGEALRLLETEAGLVPAEIREIQRQKGRYRDAVAAISKGDLGYGFRIFNDLGWIKEIGDSQKRDDALADDYVATLRSGQSCLAVSPTHVEGDRVTTSIRGKLRQKGMIEGAEHEVVSFKNLSLTEADRKDTVNYLVGDVVEYHQNAPGITKGQRLVAGRDPIRWDQASRFQTYRPQSIRLAKGDMVRITKGGKTADGKHKVENGQIYQVKDFTRGGDIVLGNGWRLSKNFGHLSYGYVSTSYASQGRTVDRVLIAQSADSIPASNIRQWYVSTSRGRHSVHVYTDDKTALLDAVNRSDERQSATDLMNERHFQARAVVLRKAEERREQRDAEKRRERNTPAFER